MAERTLVIVNEQAGGGAMADIFRRVEYRLRDILGHVDVAFTDYCGHAIALSEQALGDGVSRLVVAGGDGTLNEVVNGCFDPEGELRQPEPTIGVLAGGTGGDFRRSLGILDLDHSLDVLVQGKDVPLDVGHLSYRDDHGETVCRYFMNVASVGLSGLVGRHVARFNALPGQWAYLAATARALMDFETPQIRISVDDCFEAELPITTIAVANGRYFGGGMRIAPGASLTDGAFDFTMVSALSRWELLSLGKSIYDGSLLDEPKVLSLKGSASEIASDDEVAIDVDGEPLGWLPVRLEIRPRVLRFRVPAAFQETTL